MSRAPQQRNCQDCNWQYWQEPLRDSEGRLCDEAGRPSGTPIMVWRESGEPCEPCLERQFVAMTNVCAEGKCLRGKNCDTHRYLYTTPPCYGCGHYHPNGACGGGCSCTAVVAWPERYDPPESARLNGGKKRKAITPYHRGSDGQVAARKQVLPTSGDEGERFWRDINHRLALILRDEQELTAMARRILEQEGTEVIPCSLGEVRMFGSRKYSCLPLDGLALEAKFNDQRSTQ